MPLDHQYDGSCAAPGGEAQETLRPAFVCCLDDYPDHLVPQRCLDTYLATIDDDSALAVNPSLLLAPIEDLPVGMVPASVLDNFQPGQNMIWVGTPGAGVVRPFGLGPKSSEVLSGLLAGRTTVRELPAGIKWTLVMAQVLIKQPSPPGQLDGLTRNFREKGYAPIPDLLHPFHLSALRAHYRRLLRQGLLRCGDSQSDRRHVAHNEKVARLFHHQLTPVMTAIVAEPVKPSYVYVASYQSGAKLEKHTDREQCEFSLTLCVDYSPEPGLHTPWPLYLHTPSSVVTVFQGLGDGLVYRGCEIPHSRDVLPAGHTSTSIFFHYVRSDFEGSLD